MPTPTKIKPILENDFDSIEHETVSGLASDAKNEGMKIVHKEVIKPLAAQAPTDQEIVNYLFGVPNSETTPEDPHAAEAAAAAQTNSPAFEHSHIDSEKQMSMQEKRELTEEQKDQREKIRTHERNYYTFPGLDVIGTLEERVRQEAQKRKEEDENRKKEEEEEEEKKKQKKLQEQQEAENPMPTGKRTGMDPNALKREQNKTEQHRGQHG